MNVNDAYNKLINKLDGWLDALILMLPNILLAVIVVILFYFAARVISAAASKILRRISHHEAVNSLISRVIYIALILTGMFFALGLLQLDKTVTSLLAGLGIIGIALGFAFQDIAANFMSGIALAMRQPFKTGDYIESNDKFGRVERINLRTTDIISVEGQRVIIPNKEVYQNVLINFSYQNKRRLDLTVGVSYGEDLEAVEEITLAAVKDIPQRDTSKDVELMYDEFADSSINFTLRIWLNYNAQIDYVKAKHTAIKNIKKAYDQNGITIPFPIRTLDFGIKGGEKLSEMKINTGN